MMGKRLENYVDRRLSPRVEPVIVLECQGVREWTQIVLITSF